MKRIIRLTETDLARIVRRVIKEQTFGEFMDTVKKDQGTGQVELNLDYFKKNPKGTLTTTNAYGEISKINGIEITKTQNDLFKQFFKPGDGFGAGYIPGEYTYEYTQVRTMRKPEGEMVIDTTSIDGSRSAMYFMK